MSSLYLAVEINEQAKIKLAEKQVLLKQNCISGEFEDPTRFHITVRFLCNDEKQGEKAIEGLKLFEQLYQPNKFEIIAKNFYRFEQGVEWIGVHNSFPLYEIKHQIEDCFNQINFPLIKEQFDGYTPHITMGYDVQEANSLVKEFEGIPIIVDNISLWAGFKANDVYIHNKIYGITLK